MLLTACSSDKTYTDEMKNKKENKALKKEQSEEILAPGYTLKKSENIIFENKSGKIIYLGESVDEEGNLTAAIKQEAGTKNLDINIELKYIFPDNSYLITRTKRDTVDYRFNPNDKILILKSPYIADTEPIKIDYRILNEIKGDTLINNDVAGFLKVKKTVHTINLEKTTDTLVIPPLIK